MRRKPELPNSIMTPVNTSLRRKKIFLVVGIVRGRPTTPKVIVTVLKAPYKI